MKREKIKEISEKRQETLKRRPKLLILLCSFLLVLSCENPVTSKDKMSILPEGKGSFTLTFSNVDRTILPDTPSLSDFAVYNLAFTPTSNGSIENADRTNENLAINPILLDSGTYNLVINAYKDNGKTQLMAYGTLNGIVITAGQNTAKTVTLEALLSGGTGTFRWAITLPVGVTATMKVTPSSVGGTTEQTVTLTPPTASESRTLNSGQYSLTFNLIKTDGKTVVWKELLYVYQNLESVFNLNFTDAHLNDSAYTVTFNSNGGEPGELGRSVLHGGTIIKPADPDPTKHFHNFGGWYTDNETFTNEWNFDSPVIESFTLYAQWNIVTGLANKLAWLQTYAQNNTAYVLEVDADESINPHTLSYSGRSNITITLIGVDAERIVSLSSNGAMLTVESGVTVVLDNNITLRGCSDINPLSSTGNNDTSLVRVNSSGTLIMKTGSIITGNTNFSSSSDSRGGGVYVDNNATFTMNGGEISGNTASSSYDDGYLYGVSYSYGGGVYVGSNATFTMNSGKISDNSAYTSSSSRTSYSYGGGVCVGGAFTMNGGEISGNTAYTPSSSSVISYSYGGGVYVNGTFTMSSGKISDNTAYAYSISTPYSYGGGVYISNGTFTMEDGEITSNTVSSSSSSSSYSYSYGGGLCVSGVATFTMSSGKISGNTASTSFSSSSDFSYGGGVYMSGGAFTMEDGEISGNTASRGGGGVVVSNEGTFTMSNGTISGNTSSYNGGGVYVMYSNATFTMNGGEISDNTGGVSVYGGVFTMKSGEITGNTEGVIVGGGGAFTMSGGEISGNIGRGVYVGSNATFTISGGEISGNTASSYGGGGVYVDHGAFTMSGGKISGNTASLSSIGGGGGGVYVDNGAFTMSGGKISGNTVSSSSWWPYGGGVFVKYGVFTMSGGKISDNTVSSPFERSYGGGVYVEGGAFTMEDGEISDNTASSSSYSYGGGVCVDYGAFTMSGGKISGNTTSSSSSSSSYFTSGGGGVYVVEGDFTMSGGEISGNTSSSSSSSSYCPYGGGVYIHIMFSNISNATFTKTNGTIYGYSEDDAVNSNMVKISGTVTVQSDKGHAVYVNIDSSSSSNKRKETTAGPGVNLAYDYNDGSPTFSGDWDY